MGSNWGIVGDDIFSSTVVFFGKQQTNWGLVRNCQRKQYRDTMRCSIVDNNNNNNNNNNNSNNNNNNSLILVVRKFHVHMIKCA